ncbi:MAG TPA: hypothetical protein VNH18_19365, partial [Bryobacteraceae bacterium]|nr:hypothetical protein [Bryobacteraceae bacterium]
MVSTNRVSTNRFRRNALLVALVPVSVYPLHLQLTAQPQTSRAQLVNANIERRVNDLLRRMTLDEKIGQLTQYSATEVPSTGPAT